MADVLAVRNELRMQNWMDIIRECRESGLSNREFCTRQGISEKTYYYWLRKIRSSAAETLEPQLVRLQEAHSSRPEHMIHIHYGETELKLPENVDLKAVSILLNALRQHA